MRPAASAELAPPWAQLQVTGGRKVQARHVKELCQCWVQPYGVASFSAALVMIRSKGWFLRCCNAIKQVHVRVPTKMQV